MGEIVSNINTNYKKIIFKALGIIVGIYWVLFSVCALLVLVDRYYLYPVKYEQAVRIYADYYNLDRAYVYSIINVESRFNKDAVSVKGAVGLMQLTPSTADYIAGMKGLTVYDITNPNTNIEFGCYYLRYLCNKFNDLVTVTCAYNAGEGNVMLWLGNREYSENGITLIKIPFPETNAYIKKVQKSFEKYKKLYPYIVDKPAEFE